MVSGLREGFIPDSDCVEGLGNREADHFIGFGLQIVANVGRRDGNRDNDAARCFQPKRFHGRAHACARSRGRRRRRHVAVCEGEGSATLSVEVLLPVDFHLFGSGLTAIVADETFVQNPDAAAGDGSDGKFFIARQSQFPHQEDVEIGVERSGDLVTDRDSSARQSQGIRNHFRLRT